MGYLIKKRQAMLLAWLFILADLHEGATLVWRCGCFIAAVVPDTKIVLAEGVSVHCNYSNYTMWEKESTNARVTVDNFLLLWIT